MLRWTAGLRTTAERHQRGKLPETNPAAYSHQICLQTVVFVGPYARCPIKQRRSVLPLTPTQTSGTPISDACNGHGYVQDALQKQYRPIVGRTRQCKAKRRDLALLICYGSVRPKFHRLLLDAHLTRNGCQMVLTRGLRVAIHM
jgi:hypothetical protein